MTQTPFEIRLFSEIKHKLPADAWARWRNERNSGEFDTETVLCHHGDLTLDTLELDALPSDAAHVFLILVEGNLRVTGPIYNDDTDGAPGLIVLGDLRARNAVVGGQEIYVCGNLKIEDLFWGDYNHGTLKVAGNADIPLLLDTDEYHVEIAGAQRFRRRLSTLDAAHDPASSAGLSEPAALFPADCVIDTSGGYPILDRTRLLERLRAGLPVIHADLLQARAQPPPIPALCPDRTPSLANLERLTQADLLLQPAHAEQTPRLEFWQDDLFCRAAAGEEKDGCIFRSMYFQRAALAVTLRYDEVRMSGGLLRKPKTQWRSSLRWRRISGEQTSWQDCDALPADCADLFEQGWNALLDGAAAQAHARTLIAPQRLRTLLALPLAAPYDDFYDDDRNGLWLDNLYCAFRQEGVVRNGQPQPALLRVARQRSDEGNERHDFSLHRHLDGSESVQIEYCPQEGKDWIDISHTAPQSLEQAVRMFEAAWRALQRGNADLLVGVPPNQDDEFALGYWQGLGYLK